MVNSEQLHMSFVILYLFLRTFDKKSATDGKKIKYTIEFASFSFEQVQTYAYNPKPYFVHG